MMGAGGQKILQNFFQSTWWTEYICKIKAYLSYINWWYKSKYSSSPKDILKSAKKIHEKLYTNETTSKAPITEFFSKISIRKKISNEDFNLFEVEASLNEIIKSINSQRNNKSPGWA